MKEYCAYQEPMPPDNFGYRSTGKQDEPAFQTDKDTSMRMPQHQINHQKIC